LIGVAVVLAVVALFTCLSVTRTGTTLEFRFQDSVSKKWVWDAEPEASARYSIRIPGVKMRPDPVPFRVVDFLIVVPDPRRIDSTGLETLMSRATQSRDLEALGAFLEKESQRLRYFFDTSWTVKGREE
jgi:hypothetical protein